MKIIILILTTNLNCLYAAYLNEIGERKHGFYYNSCLMFKKDLCVRES